MITEKESMNIEYGLTVIYNGDVKYTLMTDGIVKDYPIGGLISEYARLSPAKIKDIILSCCCLESEANLDNVIDFIVDFNKHLHEKLDPVSAIMVCAEFTEMSIEWFKSQRNECEDEFLKSVIREDERYDEIKDFIFEGTPYKDIGRTTVLQEALTCYLFFATTFVTTKALFLDVTELSDADTEIRKNNQEVFLSLYGNYLDFQHIDFRIIGLKDAALGGLNNMYTIKSSMSLLLFDMANSLNKEVNFIRCPNCKQVFVPEGRSDIVYCSYPSPQNSEKTCREIGAQIKRANKEKTDVVTKEYRKVYMRLQMMTKRHPENREARKMFDRLTEKIKYWRNSLNEGTKTVEQYMSWLNEFDMAKSKEDNG